MRRIVLALKLARREMRGRLTGFRIFFACLVLGVAAISGVESLSEAFLTGLAEQGRTLLDGDVVVQLVHRTTTKAEHDFLARHGQVSQTVSLRAMAYALQNGTEAERQLVELKAVDGAYPFFGTVALEPMQSLAHALRCDGQVCGAVAEQTLLDRLHLAPGGLLKIGAQTFRVSAALTSEPDRISGGFSLGPHVIIGDDGLQRTGLIAIGSIPTFVVVVVLGAIGVSFIAAGLAVFVAGIAASAEWLPGYVTMDVEPWVAILIGPIMGILGGAALVGLVAYVRFMARLVRRVVPKFRGSEVPGFTAPSN